MTMRPKPKKQKFGNWFHIHIYDIAKWEDCELIKFQDILKLTTVPPDVLKTQIGYTKNALKLSDQSAFLTAIGVNVNNEALDVVYDRIIVGC